MPIRSSGSRSDCPASFGVGPWTCSSRPGYSLPRGVSGPSLVTVHDLSFEVLPRDFGFRERWRRRFLARRAARSATRVLTDTGRTAAELQRRYGVPEERIAVAPLGVAPRFGQARLSESRSDAGQSERLSGLGVRRPYLLVPGSILARRRLDLVLAALNRLLSEAAKTGPGATRRDIRRRPAVGHRREQPVCRGARIWAG